MDISRLGTRVSSPGSADAFTGTVRIDPLFSADGPDRAGAAAVTFAPGARTACHPHPLGPTLVVTSGVGRVQREGGPVEEIHPGDVVRIAPGVKHWHGASPAAAMAQIGVQEMLDGVAVDWLEQVGDEEYRGG